MQYEIIAVMAPSATRKKSELKVCDLRGVRPTSNAFLVGGDKWTIAPSLAVAKEVRDAFLAWVPQYGPASVQRVILRKYTPPPLTALDRFRMAVGYP